MVRKSIFDIIKDSYDIQNELLTVSDLFHRNNMISVEVRYNTWRDSSIEALVDKVFHNWKGRGTCLSCEDMRNRLDLVLKPRTDDIDEIAMYLEYFLNIILKFQEKYQDGNECEYSNAYSMMVQNIKTLLSNINHKFVFDEENEVLLVVPKDNAAIAAAEIAPKKIDFAILKYNHSSLKGNISEKKNLLLAIAGEYEPLFKKGIDGHSSLFTAITSALNNLNLRHNNVDAKGKSYKPVVESMKSEELENWYDELYQMMLFAILINDNKTRLPKVEDMLKKVNGISED